MMAQRFEFTTTGKIIYDPPRPGMKRRTEWWAIISVDREITRYFREMVRKRFFIDLCEPSWNAHVSAIRGERIHQSKQHLWKRMHGQKVTVHYSINVKQPPGKPHFWYVEAYAPEIDQMRGELGLRTDFSYHLTIGRTYNETDCHRG